MRRNASRLLALLIALPVAALLLLHLLLAVALPEEAITEWISEDLGVPVRVASASAWLLPSPRLRVVDARVGGVIRVAETDIALRLGSLLRGDLGGGRAELHGVTLGLVRTADGVSVEGLPTGEKDTGEAETPARIERWKVPSAPTITLHDAVVRYTDETASGGTASTEVRFEDLRVRAYHDRDSLDLAAHGSIGDGPGELDVEAAVAAAVGDRRPVRMTITTRGLDPEPVPRHLPAKWGIRSTRGVMDAQIELAWNDPEDFRGRLDLRFRDAEIDYAGIAVSGAVAFRADMRDDRHFALTGGVLEADRAVLHVLDLAPVKAQLSFTRDRLALDSLTATSWEGEVEAKGTVDVDDGLDLDLALEGRGLSLYRLEHPRGGSPPEDPVLLDVRGTLRGPWTGGAGWLEPLGGELDVAMHGGRVFSGDVLDTLVVSMPRHYAEHHEPSKGTALETTPLERLTGHFTLGGGHATSKDLVLVTEDYEIDAAGWLDGAAGYRFQGSLAFTPKGLSRVLAASSIRARHSERGRLPACPFAISGNLESGHFEVDLDEQPLTALVLLPWTVNSLTEGTAEAWEAGKRGVDRSVDWMNGHRDD